VNKYKQIISNSQEIDFSCKNGDYFFKITSGGNFFFGGLHFNNKGNLRLNERPYLGTKMLGGVSRGNFVFFYLENRLVAAQYVHGVLKEFSA